MICSCSMAEKDINITEAEDVVGSPYASPQI